MKTNAMITKEYGANASFVSSEIEIPEVRDNQLLIEVKATSLNPLDNKILRGKLPLGPELPAALHGDVAGIVKQVGSKVSAFNVGDEIYGVAGGLVNYCGAAAQHMVVDEDLVYFKPESLSFMEAAALPLVAVTAYEGLIDKAKIRKGQHVLVLGATGGVGHQAIQIAKAEGATVTAAVSSEEKAKLAKSLGADHVINYKTTPLDDILALTENKMGFDIVFDTVGNENIDKTWQYACINGQVISVNSKESHDLTDMFLKGISLHMVLMLLPMLTNYGKHHHQEILKYIKAKVQAKQIKPLIDKRQFKLSELNEAHAYYESGAQIGKIVIAI